MKRRHSVNAESVMNVDMRHMNSIVSVYDGCWFIAESSANFIIKYLNDRNELRHNLF